MKITKTYRSGMSLGHRIYCSVGVKDMTHPGNYYAELSEEGGCPAEARDRAIGLIEELMAELEELRGKVSSQL